jgi:hypothetical protein
MSPADSHISADLTAPTDAVSSSMDPDPSASEEHHRPHRHRRRTSHRKRKLAIRYALLAILYIGAILVGLLIWFKLT